MRGFFLFWSFREGVSGPQWKTISKQRLRLCSYFLLKELMPKKWRPSAWVERFVQRVGGSGCERPDLRHLLEKEKFPDECQNFLNKENLQYLCVMPSSKWSGKNWPVESYLTLIKKLPYFPVILGTEKDAQSKLLCDKLQSLGIPHFNGVGKWNLGQTCHVLKNSSGYLGGDTGLAHLAESIGIPARVIFGPTTPDMGFKPWRNESRTFGLSLWCRPCGKDGRICLRLTQKYMCLKDLTPENILNNWR